MSENCISCGMPHSEAKKHPGHVEGRDWCQYCAAENGALKTYDEVLAGFTDFLSRTEALSPEDARERAMAQLALQPAWAGRIV